jgi:hypothetical protein
MAKKESTSKKQSTTKKKSRRSRTKYPALDPGLNLKTRTDLIDYDYIDKLSPREKKWLNKFTEEYAGASLNAQDLKKNLHNTEALKKDCYDRNNARNRCILTLQRAQGKIEYTEENTKILGENPEEGLNKELDSQTRHYYDDYNVLSEPSTGKILRRRKE